jgi:hypothetical protein
MWLYKGSETDLVILPHCQPYCGPWNVADPPHCHSRNDVMATEIVDLGFLALNVRLPMAWWNISSTAQPLVLQVALH